MKETNAPSITLDFALQNQVISEVEDVLSSISDADRITASRKIMGYILNPEADHVEFSVEFITRLITVMVKFVNGLIQSRVNQILSETKPTKSKRKSDPTRTSASGVAELTECDSFLRSLRTLKQDMLHRFEIDQGISVPIEKLARTATVPISPFSNSQPMESVIERSLMSSTSCFAYHWLSTHHYRIPGEYMRSMSRLIAYMFFCSQQMDSFFVGINILRQSGEHVNAVLFSIYNNTSIKFVRDRIYDHLKHGSNIAEDNTVLKNLEFYYSLNCYETELNRKWSILTQIGTTTISDSSTSSAVPIDCGNIPDILVSRHSAHSGNIGGVTLEESVNVLRCIECKEQQRFGPCVIGDGYLHITLSWIGKMTGVEIQRIFLEKKNEEKRIEFMEKLYFYIHHKNLNEIVAVIISSPNPVQPTVQAGTFLDRIIVESFHKKFISTDPEYVNAISISESAAIGALLSKSVFPNALKHQRNIRWLMVQNELPQVVLLYLRKYKFSLHDVEPVLGESDWLRIFVRGRLGNSALSSVSRMMGHDMDAMMVFSEWMMTGQCEDKDLVVEKFPKMARFFEVEYVTQNNKPKWCDDIYELPTYKYDLTVGQLLEDIYPDLDLVPQEFAVDKSKSWTHETEYLLSQGRPSLAYHSCYNNLDMSDLQVLARRVAFYNLFDDGIVASCISFLDLFSESTETLRVDIQSARSISLEKSKLVNLFLSFNSSGNNLLTALKLLEESAWAREPPNVENVNPSPQPGFESPWHLVALFCRVHNLPRSLTLLHELARNGDWVMFLHESDLQQCPIDTVRDVINFYFSQSPLRSHLNILLGELNSQGGGVAGRRWKGLEYVLKEDREGWRNGGDTLIVREREIKLFNLENDILFNKYFNLFDFQRAREYYTDNVQVECTGLLKEEFEDMRGHAGGTEESLGVGKLDECDLVDSVVANDMEVDLGEVIESVRRAFEEGDLSSVCINSTEVYLQFLEIAISGVKSGLDFCEIVSMVKDLELFGDFLTHCLNNDCLDRNTVTLLAYYAYCLAFIDKAKFDFFIDSVRGDNRVDRELMNQHIPELSSDTDYNVQLVNQRDKLKFVEEVNANGRKEFEICVIADALFEKTLERVDTGEEDLIQALGAVVKISGIYKQYGLLKKHIEANRVAIDLVERLRTSCGLT